MLVPGTSARRVQSNYAMKSLVAVSFLSAAVAFAYAAVVTHVPSSEASDTVACGDKDAQKKKDKKNEDNS